MASIPSFIFGGNSKYKTQEELERAREQVASMLGDIGQSKFTGWGSVLSDIGKGIGARVEKGRIGEGQEFLTGEQSKLWDMFGGGGGYDGGGAVTGDAGADALAGNGSLDGYLSSIRSAESGGNDNAKNPRSSASGRYQFTRGTWDNMIRTHPELGLTRDGMFDAAQQERAIRAFTADNANVLQSAGIPITGGTLYGAHFLGAGGAKQAFRNDDNAPMSSVVGPGVIQANPFLSRMTVGDFKRWTAQKGGGAAIDLFGGGGGGNAIAGGGKNDVAFSGVDPYGALPATDTLGEDQRAKFRDWNSDPIGNEADILKNVDPALAGVIRRAKEIAGTNFVVASGQRTPEMQAKAKKFGWSKTLDSDHLGGGASDLWPVDENGQIVFDKERQAKIASAMKQAAQELGVDLEAGADWKSPDRPHFGLVGQTPMTNAPIPAARPDGAGVDPVVTGSTSRGPSLLQARPVPINEAGVRTSQGQEFLGRMSSPASMGGGQQPAAMVSSMTGPMPQPQPQPAPPLPPPPPAQPPQASPAPVPAPPAPAPVPPAPLPQVDPFTSMILGDKAAQFKPGNYIPPAPLGKQVFPAAPPAPGTPAAAGFGVPPVVGGGGADQLAGKGTFPPAPVPPRAQQAGGGDKIAKLQFILTSPYASKEQKLMAGAMLEREYKLQDDAANPLTQLQLEKARLEVEKLKGGGAGPFSGDGVEAQALNGMVASGRITLDQAYDLATGKTVTDPETGEIIFKSGTQLISQFPGQPAQPVQPDATAPAGTPAAGTPAATPATPPRTGTVLTGKKPAAPPSETERRAQALVTVASPELKIVEQMFPALGNIDDQLLSKMPWNSSNWATSENYQRGKNALQSLITSYMFVVSGSDTPPAQVALIAEGLMPQPGEKPASVKDKLARVRNYVEAMKQAAGRAAQEAAPAGGGNVDYNSIYGLPPVPK